MELKDCIKVNTIKGMMGNINQIEYPREKIEKLVGEGNIEGAQKLYFEYELKTREGIIRL